MHTFSWVWWFRTKLERFSSLCAQGICRTTSSPGGFQVNWKKSTASSKWYLHPTLLLLHCTFMSSDSANYILKDWWEPVVIRVGSSWHGEGVFGRSLIERRERWRDQRFPYRSNGHSCAPCSCYSLVSVADEAILSRLVSLLHGRVRSEPTICVHFDKSTFTDTTTSSVCRYFYILAWDNKGSCLPFCRPSFNGRHEATGEIDVDWQCNTAFCALQDDERQQVWEQAKQFEADLGTDQLGDLLIVRAASGHWQLAQ